MWGSGAGLHSRLIDLYLAYTAWVPDSKNNFEIDPRVSQKLENIKANCQNNFPHRLLVLRPGHWSLHIGDIGQGGPFDVPNVSGLRGGHSVHTR